MDEFKIEKGIPIPERYTRKTPKYTWDYWSKMEVGDSVLIKIDEPDPMGKIQASIVGYAINYGKNYDKKFVSRKQESGVRIWRVK